MTEIRTDYPTLRFEQVGPLWYAYDRTGDAEGHSIGQLYLGPVTGKWYWEGDDNLGMELSQLRDLAAFMAALSGEQTVVIGGGYRSGKTTQAELFAIKGLCDTYDEFGKPLDPECQLPELATRVHGIMAELADRRDPSLPAR
jgi:hypothetical protein